MIYHVLDASVSFSFLFDIPSQCEPSGIYELYTGESICHSFSSFAFCIGLTFQYHSDTTAVIQQFFFCSLE